MRLFKAAYQGIVVSRYKESTVGSLKLELLKFMSSSVSHYASHYHASKKPVGCIFWRMEKAALAGHS